MKGKAAVQNANRRTAEAVERADRLAAELTAEKQARKAEVRVLADELRETRLRIDRLAEDQAAEKASVQVAKAVAAAARERETLRAAAVVTMRELLQAWHQNTLEMEHFVSFARRFDVEPHEVIHDLVASPHISRYSRRLTWGEYIRNLRRVDAGLGIDKQQGAEFKRRFIGADLTGEGDNGQG